MDRSPLRPGVTVLGNLAIDRIDGGPPAPGGCPSFARVALGPFGEGRVVTRAARADLGLFAEVLAPAPVAIDVLPADVTSAFGMQYDGAVRSMTVDALGPVWGAAQARAAAIDTTWVHIAPLLRSDFPPEFLAALVAGGHRLAFDAQGLVRAPTLGPLVADAHYDPAMIASLSVLKLADDEAAVLVGGAFDRACAAQLGVPEILVTAGPDGCRLFVDGQVHDVPAAWRVDGVHATGAGDIFTVSYVAARARGDQPVEAAQAASQLVAEALQVRRECGG